MKLTISFKHLEHTPSLDKRIRKKSKKLEKYLNGEGRVSWTCYVKNNSHCAELVCHGPGFEYFAKGVSENLYKSLDKAISKMEKQIAKKMEKMKDKLHRERNRMRLVCLDPENAWTDYDEEKEGYHPNFYKNVA
jgi:putative sigma-54 modulation protein